MSGRHPHLVRRAVALSVLVGASLGIVPPVRSQVPPTVMRSVPLEVADLVGERVAARADGAVRADRPTWTSSRTACAPIRFTMVGFTWRQSGADEVPVEMAWGGRGDMRGRITLHADPAEGPDPGSPDESGIDGTQPVWTGEARCVRIRLRLPSDERFEDLRAVFLNTSGTAEERSPLEVVGAGFVAAWNSLAGLWGPSQAGAMTSQPSIITRAEWGANERLRRVNCDGEPDYAPKLKMAYVHHTAGTNSYSRNEADDIVRGIYSYHVHGRGFCDIAYNFLISKYGDIFEGRYGGMDRPVIGGHAMGFNTGSTGISALGDFSRRAAPPVMVRAYRRLLAWRLDEAHLRPRGKTIMVSAGGSTTRYGQGQRVELRIISGHRDTGYTTCPGNGLYSRLKAIRRGAQRIGLPKIWSVERMGHPVAPGESTVRFRAGFSRELRWTLDITSVVDGTTVRDFSGTSQKLVAEWNGTDEGGNPVAPDAYRVTIEARVPGGGAEARPATLRTRVEAPAT
jgi:N-acetylmuramoyl-L-alanine amidase